MNQRLARLLLPCILLLTVLLAIAYAKVESVSDVMSQLDVLIDVRHEIVSNYVEEPDQQKMVDAAVKAMVDSLDDPYTVYLSPQDLEPFEKTVEGTFSGIGAEIDIDPTTKRLRIVSPLDASPAWEAGVMAGDTVLEIDGESTEGINIREAVRKLTGTAGTQVTVLVRHESGQEATITITRAVINVETVRGLYRDHDQNWVYMIDPVNKIGYLRLRQFNSRAADETKAVIQSLLDQGMKGLIFDVRFNPGGLLEAATQIADMFLPEGKVIVSIKGRTVREVVHRSTAEPTFPDFPMVLLTNEYSASASEILAGALKDNDRAHIVGMRTFGKGSVQQVRSLEVAPGAIKITNAYYYIPSGRKIHRVEGAEHWGVDPHEGFFVPMTPEQIKEMNNVRRENDVLRHDNGQSAMPVITPEYAREDLKDLQLAAAMQAMLVRIKDGKWQPVGESGADLIARMNQRQRLQNQRDWFRDNLDRIEKELDKLDHKATDEDDADKTASDVENETQPDLEPAVAP